MMKKFLLLFLLFPTIVFGQTIIKYPSTPMLIVGPQGRPIPDGLASVSDLSGVPVTTFTGLTGATANPRPFIVPATGIVQFFADPGLYSVTVTGNGVNRTFYVPVGTGVPTSSRFISISRQATNFDLNVTSPGTLSCPLDKPCCISLDDDVSRSFQFDWIMPSFGLDLLTFMISFTTDTGNNGRAAAFETRWCTYGNNEAICTPANGFDSSITVSSDGKRTDLTITQASLSTLWEESDHVRVLVFREPGDADDTVVGNICVENIVLEFERE